MSTSRPAPRPWPAVDPSHFEKGQVPRRAAHMEAAATGLRSAAGGDRRARDVMGWPSAFMRSQPVPELTRSVDVNLIARVSLRGPTEAIAWSAPDIAPHPDTAWRSRRAILFRSAALFSS